MGLTVDEAASQDAEGRKEENWGTRRRLGKRRWSVSVNKEGSESVLGEENASQNAATDDWHGEVWWLNGRGGIPFGFGCEEVARWGIPNSAAVIR